MRRIRLFQAARAVVAAVVTGLLVGAVAMAGPASAAPAAACSWRLDTRLPLPAGSTSATISATDGAADFAGSAWNFSVSDQFHAVVWHAGRASLLPTPVGSGSMAFGMNRRGDVVGSVIPPSGGSKPVLWRAGRLVELATATTDTSANARDINDAGLIVGEAVELTTPARVVAWSASEPGKFRYVRSPASQSFVSAVTEDGVLAGDYVSENTSVSFGVAAAGTVADGLHAVPLPTPDSSSTISAAAGRYFAGFVAPLSGMQTHAVLWRDEVPQLLSKDDTWAIGVNSRGAAVGSNFTTGRAVVWIGGVEQPLPIISTGPSVTSASASVLTEDDAVAGAVNTATGDSRPVVWHCR